ncbi:uncharacterized protein LOC120414507 [Culex pipiens pallens]|uniref:uncharacterized protein LOC120414507 n=1 Tax=Culex pipiens pallens TaxID=42434 RepID=UPI001954F10C|nr:uncharacterized protein LOC120414507 [Culex pipiens pallens]
MAICRVKGCKSTRSNPTVTLHKFPKDPNVRDKWLKFCGCADGQNLFVCSLHFRENDYEHIFMQNAKKILQKSAVPSIRVPAVESARDNRVSCRNRKKLVVELLEADEIRSKEAADYQKLLHEVYEPLSPFDWFPSVSVTDPAIVRPESVSVTSGSRSPAVDVSLPVPAIEQPESVALTSGCRSPAVDAAIVRPESVSQTSGIRSPAADASVLVPAIVRPERVSVTSGSRSPAVDVSLPVPAIEQPESVALSSGCRSPAVDAAIVRPESVGLTSGIRSPAADASLLVPAIVRPERVLKSASLLKKN